MEEGFLLGGVAVGDDVAGVAGECGEIVVREWLRLFVGFGQFCASGFEAGELLGEGGDAGSAGLFGHGARFEGVEVAVEFFVRLA
ncbi:MAG TPA: hypothetical protein VKP14_07730 [Gaiellaceae bacterium]|nr:hypothetical protein [Gaiellaceae bacterium]